MEDKVYTVKEFAKIMKMSAWSAYKMVREKRVASIKIGVSYRIPVRAVDKLISSTSTQKS